MLHMVQPAVTAVSSQSLFLKKKSAEVAVTTVQSQKVSLSGQMPSSLPGAGITPHTVGCKGATENYHQEAGRGAEGEGS